MLTITIIGIALVAITAIIHALGTTYWVKWLSDRHPMGKGLHTVRASLSAILKTVVIAVLLHAIEILVWAVAYRQLVPGGELATLEEAVYFSFVTFTTLGYGDITLSEGWRLLSGIEALNGILLVGWTTALLFTVVQKAWQVLGSQDA